MLHRVGVSTCGAALDTRDGPQPSTGLERTSIRLDVLRKSHRRTGDASRQRLKPERLGSS
jgi:hypothetical protein